MLSQAAYGFRVQGIDDPRGLALLGAGSWPELTLEPRLEATPPGMRDHIGEHDAAIQTPAAQLLLDRAGMLVVVRAEQPVPVTDLVHPCLWPAAAVFARWTGSETFHAGAFIDPAGDAWAVLGDRETGKSTLLAMLARAGRPVLVDDLLVMQDGECFSGPRSIDLRPETVHGLDLTEETAPVRSTQRLRLFLDPIEGRMPLRGFIYPAWGDDASVQPVVPAEHLGLLTHHRRVAVLGANVEQLLNLAALPAVRFTRPRAWNAASEACDQLLEALVRSPART